MTFDDSFNSVYFKYDYGNGHFADYYLVYDNSAITEDPTPQPTQPSQPAQPAAPSIPATQNVSSVALKAKKNTVAVSWANPQQSKAVSKIEVQYATKKNFKKNLKTRKLASGKTKVTLKKLKKKTKYFIRVRYRYTDGTMSGWSSVKTVKTK